MKIDWEWIAVMAFIAVLFTGLFASIAISNYSQALIELAKAGCN